MLHLRQSRVAARCDDGRPVDHDAWEQLARSEHDRWSAFHYLENWRYGVPRIDVARIHDNLQPWEKLKVGTRQYDASHVAKLPMFLDRLSHEQQDQDPKTQLCREIRIGIVGHRPHRLKGHLAWLDHRTVKEDCLAKGEKLNHPEVDALVNELRNTFRPGPTDLPVKFVLVTGLAEGADRALARALLAHEALNAELQPVLPLPWEIYRTTFAANPKNESSTKHRSEEQALELIQDNKTRRHIQMPMLYGSAAEISNDKENKASGNPQQKQYQLANAWIVQNCDYLIAAWDGREIGTNSAKSGKDDVINGLEALPYGKEKPYTKDVKPGGTWEAVRWWLDPTAIPESMQWPSHWHPICADIKRAPEDRLFFVGSHVAAEASEPGEEQ